MPIPRKKRNSVTNAFGHDIYVPDMGGLDLDAPDFGLAQDDVDEFDYDLYDYDREDNNTDIRYMRPSPAIVPTKAVRYDNAQALARDIVITPGMRWDVMLTGTFIFGDFIEAFLTHNMCKAVNMTIGTLSMSRENVDSLYNMMMHGYIDELRIMTSTYFYSHERRDIIPYLYKKLDIDNRFQLAVTRIHTKTIHFQSLGGKKIIIHGSANLRSSGCVEQITIEENPTLYDFYDEAYNTLFDYYKTINKAVESRASWAEMEKRLFEARDDNPVNT